MYLIYINLLQQFFNVQIVSFAVNGSLFKLAIEAFEITLIFGSCLAFRHNKMFQPKVYLFPLVENGIQ